MAQSESIAKLTTALIAAQREMKPAIKDATNPHFRSRYVDLSGAWEAAKDALWSHGLTVIQTTVIGAIPIQHTGKDGEVTEFPSAVLVTTLAHDSGEWISGDYPLTPIKPDPQGLGAALTYARRYALMAILGLAPEDDDGNAASGHTQSQPQDRRQPPPRRDQRPPAKSANGGGGKMGWGEWVEEVEKKKGVNKYQLTGHIFKWLFGEEAQADTATRFRNVSARFETDQRAEIIDEVKHYIGQVHSGQIASGTN